MSIFRRTVCMSNMGTTYYTKFTLKFEENSDNNLVYINYTKYYGIGFSTGIGATPLSGYNKIKDNVREKITITNNKTGAIIYKADNIYEKNSLNERKSHLVYNTKDSTPLESGLYTVEILWTSSGEINCTKDAVGIMINRFDIAYVNCYSAKSGTDKNATTVTTNCLYSIEVERPKGNVPDIGSLTPGKKGVINNMTYFVEGV